MDKKARIRLSILIVIILLIGVIGVYAAYTHTLNSPADGSWSTGTVNFSGLCIQDDGNSTNVSLWHDGSGAFIYNSSLGNTTGRVQNNTYWSISWGFPQNYTGYKWNAKCVNSTDASVYSWISGGNFTIKVDLTNPVTNNKYPADKAFWNNQTNIYFKSNGTEVNPGFCYLYHNMTGTWLSNNTQTFVNSTDIAFDPVSPIGYQRNITWNVKCDDLAGNVDWGTNRTLFIDYEAPILTANNFTDNYWANSYLPFCDPEGNCNLTISVTVSDLYPDTCELWSDVAGDGFALNNTQSTVTNGSILQFTQWLEVAENSTGISYNVWCNDSGGLSTWLKTNGNYTLFIDTKIPTRVTIILPANVSYVADLTPSLNWTNSSDVNFESYILQASDTTDFTQLWINEIVTTDNSINQTTSVLDLSGNITDQTIYVRINTTDDAGQGNMSEVHQINFKQSCSVLEANKYSYCSIVRDTNVTLLSMSKIGSETGADFVYKWEANHSWTTHTVGSSVNQYINFSRGEVAVIHIASSAGNQSWNGRRIWSTNITFGGHASETFNFTNTTSSNWNLVPWINLTDTSFESVFISMNYTGVPSQNKTGDGNVTYFSYPNWNGTGLRYLGYVWGRGSPWNKTVIESGSAFWAAYEGTDSLSARWNWTMGQ